VGPATAVTRPGPVGQPCEEDRPLHTFVNLIDNMQNEGYPDSAIVAVIRCQAEAERRQMDDWCDELAEADRASLAAAVAGCEDYFA
jgi:hypothetical protein